ncbi:MAG: EcsC family protein [Myxococcota bacterium]|jgi:hypothetical protein|nr:EcsC family protein [Myxococcota bacterium]
MGQKKLDKNTIYKALDWGYDKAVNGVPGLDSAEELAQSYMKEGGSKIDQANSLIRWQIAKAGTSGFVTGLGGLLTLPVAIPANIASVLYVQLRMIAAIAHMGGHDIREDQVRTLAYLCLCGSAATDVVKDVGIQIGWRVTKTAIQRISGETLKRIDQAVGFRLLTKFGQTGVVNLGKVIPILGGIVSGAFDSVTTNTIGNVARQTFIEAT